MPRRARRWKVLASVLGAVAVAEVTAAVVLALVAGMTWAEALEAFVVTNGLMGVSFGLSGWLVAWHRPRNPIGWLLLADGIGHATSALMAPLVWVLLDVEGTLTVQRVATTVFFYAWPWSIALFLPLILLLFPDGRLPSRRWRPVLVAVVVTAPLFVLEMGLEEVRPGEQFPNGYLTSAAYDDLSWLWTVAEIRTLAALVAGLLALVVRYRRADEVQRRQLLWLLLAGLAVVAAVLPWSFVAGTPILVLLAIPLIPVAIAIAVVRHQLLDIRLVVSRTVSWLILSLLALVAYVGLVTALDFVVSGRAGRSALATVVVALVVAPVLPRLQRLVDRVMYGDRRDPARVASRLGEHLTVGDETGLPGVVGALRRALRLPYVALTRGGETLAADGAEPVASVELGLEYAGEVVGSLVVGLRPGEKVLAASDRSALAVVAAPLAVAVRALDLSADLQASRERLVLAREDERRRLRRDLHDGLGPALTGMAMTADASANLLDSEPERVRELLTSLGHDVRVTLADVRRLVDDLRPAALDDLGLTDALRQRADQLARRGDGGALDVHLDLPDALPALPAAVEVAAYRIATEALTNVARHSGARGAVLRMTCQGTLDVEVTDDGHPNGPWQPGVGLVAMRERATEVGGRFEAGPGHEGGRVFVSIPLVRS